MNMLSNGLRPWVVVALGLGCCCSLASGAAGDSQDGSSRLQIQIPKGLFRSGGYPHQEALFGIPLYGGSIAEQLYYPGVVQTDDGITRGEWTLCDDASASSFVNPNKESPFILMVDRGDCTFVSKVRRAQHMGASGVIIADNKCLCSEAAQGTCVAAECEAVEPIMGDDGSGADITIPSFLMKKPDVERVVQQFMASEMVILEMAWAMPAPDNRVEWSLWTSPWDPTAVAFKRDFGKAVKALGKQQLFEPSFAIIDGAQFGCSSPDHKCGNLCTNGGRYCMVDPDADPESGLAGAELVTESLRQKCIWNLYGGPEAPEKQRGIGEAWWNYADLFNTNCGSTRFSDAACISGVMKKVGVDEGRVNECMKDSGGTTADSDNTILQAELHAKSTKSIVVTPTVYVNNVVERGGITLKTVLTTICAGYEANSIPGVCACTSSPTTPLLLGCLEDNSIASWTGGGMGGASGLSASGTLTVAFGIVLAMTAAGFAYYRHTQNHMRDQVRGILAEYMPLDDVDNPHRQSLMTGQGGEAGMGAGMAMSSSSNGI